MENLTSSRRLGRLAAWFSREPVAAYRVGVTVVLTGYLAAIVLTGYVPLSPALDVPLGLTGWLLFAAPMVWGLRRRRIWQTDELLASLLRPPALAGVFAVLVLITSYFALAWQLPPACHGISANCFKGYEWSAGSGHFYHVTAEGVGAPISISTYISEVGVHLRSAAAFGVFALCFAWTAAMTLERPRPTKDTS